MYYEKAREYKADDDDVIVTLDTLADVYAEIKQPEKALATYKEALKRLETRAK